MRPNLRRTSACLVPAPAFQSEALVGQRGGAPLMNGAILIGGRSRRMGTAKAALEFHGRTLAEIGIDLLSPFVESVALIGHVPVGLTALRHRRSGGRRFAFVDDHPGIPGPLAGVVAGLSRAPSADWLFLPCDMACMTPEAIQWLVSQHDGSAEATVAILPGCEHMEPFPVVLRPGALAPLWSFVRSGGRSLHHALSVLRSRIVRVPDRLVSCWRNINTPVDWRRHLRRTARESGRFEKGAG
jgi:molybdopterin-guanine dinucleotide biosynthesis protein A